MRWPVLYALICINTYHAIAQSSLNPVLKDISAPLGSPSIGGIYFTSLKGWTSSSGDCYAFLAGVDSLYVAKLSDVGKITWMHPIDLNGTAATHRALCIQSHYLWTTEAGSNGELACFDLSYLPDSMPRCGHPIAGLQGAQSIAISGNRLVLGESYYSGIQYLLTELNVSDPLNPTYIGSSDFSGYTTAHAIECWNDSCWVHSGQQGLLGIRWTSTLTLFDEITVYSDKGFNHSGSINLKNRWLVFGDEQLGLKPKLMDLAGLEIGLLPNSGAVLLHQPTWVGPYVGYAAYAQGIMWYDVHDPSNAMALFNYDTYPDSIGNGAKVGCFDVFAQPDFPWILASDTKYGLHVFQVNFPLGISTHQVNYGLRQSGNSIAYDFPEVSGDLVLFDASGREVDNCRVMQKKGIWTPRPCPSGMYVCRWNNSSCANTCIFLQP